MTMAGRTVIDDYRVIAAAASGAGQADELGATLVAAVVCPPWAGFLSVGDSFAAMLTAGPPEACRLVVSPRIDPRGTDFLSAPWAKEMLHCVVLRDERLSGVVLATDGVAALALDHPAAHGLDPASGPQPASSTPAAPRSMGTMPPGRPRTRRWSPTAIMRCPRRLRPT